MKFLSLFSGIGRFYFTGIDLPIPANYIKYMANKYTKLILDHDKMVEFYNSGMTQIEVAQELGTTQKVIWQRLKKMGVKCRIAAKRKQNGENNSSWKGNKATYTAFHCRIYALKGRPKKCEICGTVDANKTYNWANLTGQYDNPDDYKRMCRSCHCKHDGTINNIKKMGGKIDVRKN